MSLWQDGWPVRACWLHHEDDDDDTAAVWLNNIHGVVTLRSAGSKCWKTSGSCFKWNRDWVIWKVSLHSFSLSKDALGVWIALTLTMTTRGKHVHVSTYTFQPKFVSVLPFCLCLCYILYNLHNVHLIYLQTAKFEGLFFSNVLWNLNIYPGVRLTSLLDNCES